MTLPSSIGIRRFRTPVLSCIVIATALSFSQQTSGFAAVVPSVPEASDSFRWNAFFGPFHVVLLHFPIGFIVAAAGLEICAWRRSSADLRAGARILLWFAFLAGVIASAAGLFRASEGGFDPNLTLEHRNQAFAFLAATLVAAVSASFAVRPSAGLKPKVVYTSSFIASLLLVGSAGHHGGNLTHGSDFLTQGAPPFIVKMFTRAKTPPVQPSTAVQNPPGTTPNDSSTATGIYSQRIRPILESRCYSCHGPEKQKGDYRIDLRDRALAAGDSGSPGIVPGDPLKSQVVKLVVLPRDHDDAMPPEGKQALTPDEILAMIHWIQAGAPFDSPTASKP